MLSRAARAGVAPLLALLVALSAGCVGLGFGAQTVVPGPTQRHFPHGALLAARFGLGRIQLGDRTLDAAAADFRAEYHHAPLPELGFSGAIGFQGEWVSRGADDVSRSGVTFAATATVVPIRPFILRLGAFLQPTTTAVEGVETDGISRGLTIGPGLVARFHGWYYVLSFDWQLSSAGTVLTADGPQAYRSDQVLLNLVLVRWDRSAETPE